MKTELKLAEKMAEVSKDAAKVWKDALLRELLAVIERHARAGYRSVHFAHWGILDEKHRGYLYSEGFDVVNPDKPSVEICW
jgi:hypothetical protein